MPSVIATDMPTIALAVEQQLLTFTSAITGIPVCGDISNIYWVDQRSVPEPVTTGKRDVLLEFMDDQAVNVEGDGRFAKLRSGMRLWLRTSLASDRRGTRKDWFTDNRTKVNGLLDAMMGFFPVDAQQNALTIDGFVITQNDAPLSNRDPSIWGYCISSYVFHYLPKINTSILAPS